MVEPKQVTSNPSIDEETLTQIFDTLSDWEKQLRSLPPEHLRFIEENEEEPTP